MTVSQETRDRVVQQAGALSTSAVRRLEADLEWYRALSAADRSWIGLVAQAGVAMANRMWEGPQALPTLAELRQPAAWIARMDGTPASALPTTSLDTTRLGSAKD